MPGHEAFATAHPELHMDSLASSRFMFKSQRTPGKPMYLKLPVVPLLESCHDQVHPNESLWVPDGSRHFDKGVQLRLLHLVLQVPLSTPEDDEQPGFVEESQHSTSTSVSMTPKRMSRKTRDSNFATVWFESSSHDQLGAPPVQPPPGYKFALGDLYLHFLTDNSRSSPKTWFRSVSEDGSHIWLSVDRGFQLPGCVPRRYLSISAKGRPSWILLTSIPKLLGTQLDI
ncbi:hypothetical protein BD769DRAFT_1391795 [Suillus cothurnatus]|nr:hypothetical protein BD769DRAFT_1391795 [Suillus cothurnatus]